MFPLSKVTTFFLSVKKRQKNRIWDSPSQHLPLTKKFHHQKVLISQNTHCIRLYKNFLIVFWGAFGTQIIS